MPTHPRVRIKPPSIVFLTRKPVGKTHANHEKQAERHNHVAASSLNSAMSEKSAKYDWGEKESQMGFGFGAAQASAKGLMRF